MPFKRPNRTYTESELYDYSVAALGRKMRTIAELKPIMITSQFYPHRPYKGIAARFEGSEEFTYTQGASTWVCIRPRSRPDRYDGRHRASG